MPDRLEIEAARDIPETMATREIRVALATPVTRAAQVTPETVVGKVTTRLAPRASTAPPIVILAKRLALGTKADREFPGFGSNSKEFRRQSAAIIAAD